VIRSHTYDNRTQSPRSCYTDLHSHTTIKSIIVEIPFCEMSIYVTTGYIKTALNMSAINGKVRTVAMFVMYHTILRAFKSDTKIEVQ